MYFFRIIVLALLAPSAAISGTLTYTGSTNAYSNDPILLTGFTSSLGRLDEVTLKVGAHFWLETSGQAVPATWCTAFDGCGVFSYLGVDFWTYTRDYLPEYHAGTIERDGVFYLYETAENCPRHSYELCSYSFDTETTYTTTYSYTTSIELEAARTGFGIKPAFWECIATVACPDGVLFAEVTYRFAEVPLPAGLPLLGAGIGALALVRARRSSVKASSS